MKVYPAVPMASENPMTRSATPPWRVSLRWNLGQGRSGSECASYIQISFGIGHESVSPLVSAPPPGRPLLQLSCDRHPGPYPAIGHCQQPKEDRQRRMLAPQPDHDGRKSRTQPDGSQASGEDATTSTEICPSRTPAR